MFFQQKDFLSCASGLNCFRPQLCLYPHTTKPEHQVSLSSLCITTGHFCHHYGSSQTHAPRLIHILSHHTQYTPQPNMQWEQVHSAATWWFQRKAAHRTMHFPGLLPLESYSPEKKQSVCLSDQRYRKDRALTVQFQQQSHSLPSQ